MYFDLVKYKEHIPLVRRLLKTKSCNKKTQSEMVTALNEQTFLPIIVICYFVAGVMGRTDPDLKQKIDNIVAYYHYSDTIGFEVFDGRS